MKPVFQSKVGKEGTCLTACVASILEVEEAAIGDLYADDTPEAPSDLGQVSARLARLTSFGLAWTTVAPAGLSIGIGRSLRNAGYLHAVVCDEGRIVHDPSPRGPDCETLHTWGLLFPMATNAPLAICGDVLMPDDSNRLGDPVICELLPQHAGDHLSGQIVWTRIPGA